MKQACIVRVMKVRKRMEHKLLVEEVTRQISHRFVPQVSEIKRNMDRLIEKEYIERDPDDIDVYVYVP